MADRKPESSSAWLIVSVLFVIAVMGLYVLSEFTGYSVLAPFRSDQLEGADRAEGSLQPAVEACKRSARAQIGSALLDSRMDSMSTRYLADTQEYFVILDLTIEGQERTAYYYECNVMAVSQQVVRTRVTGPPGTFEQIGIE
ncbi:hypothetical protein [Reinekea blandensis]|uniref:Uncharacterized protein n=1 Tax=Reinekea blandensis MED297 TaxID=314283 RepID=A4BFX7_9GAMM|nr:hypothetical protein [Reinekea blandensis]EAR08995.1 hypothetical protein MED297_03862 [Reinekea sp. MED297] [Reinekea blandensis MED297]